MVSTLVGWRVTYTDGTRYNSQDHNWDDLPTYGIQCVFKYWKNEKGYVTTENHNGADCYYIFPIESEQDAIDAQGKVKFGELMEWEDFHSLWKQELEFAMTNKIISETGVEVILNNVENVTIRKKYTE